MHSDNRELQLALQMADASGEIQRRYFRTPLPVESKKDESPVTLADRECESVMRALIQKNFPVHGIVGEEHGNIRSRARNQWVLDPIDGTRSFIAGEPSFTTLIALTRNKIPILGIIDQSISKQRWVGMEGHSATLNGKPVSVRETTMLPKAAITTSSTDYFTKDEAQRYEQLRKVCKKSSLGGDAYAYAMLASGKSDIVIDAGMKPYDFCALKPVVEGAGGIITDWEGKPLTLTSDGRILAAATKELHKQALTIVQQ